MVCIAFALLAHTMPHRKCENNAINLRVSGRSAQTHTLRDDLLYFKFSISLNCSREFCHRNRNCTHLSGNGFLTGFEHSWPINRRQNGNWNQSLDGIKQHNCTKNHSIMKCSGISSFGTHQSNSLMAWQWCFGTYFGQSHAIQIKSNLNL